MYYIEIGALKYLYLVGPYTVGIITPSRKKYLIRMGDILNPAITVRPTNGSADDRITPEEVAAYVLKCNLK